MFFISVNIQKCKHKFCIVVMQSFKEYHSNIFYYIFGFYLLKFTTLWFLRTEELNLLSSNFFFSLKILAQHVYMGLIFHSAAVLIMFFIYLIFSFQFHIERLLFHLIFLLFLKCKQIFFPIKVLLNLLLLFLMTVLHNHH